MWYLIFCKIHEVRTSTYVAAKVFTAVVRDRQTGSMYCTYFIIGAVFLKTNMIEKFQYIFYRRLPYVSNT